MRNAHIRQTSYTNKMFMKSFASNGKKSLLLSCLTFDVMRIRGWRQKWKKVINIEKEIIK